MNRPARETAACSILVLADSPAEFADALARLLSNPAEAQALGQAAFHSVQNFITKNRQALVKALRR